MIVEVTIECGCGQRVTVQAATIGAARNEARYTHFWRYSPTHGDRCTTCATPGWTPSLVEAVNLTTWRCSLCGVQKIHGDHEFGGLFGHDRTGHEVLRKLLAGGITTLAQLKAAAPAQILRLQQVGLTLAERVTHATPLLTPEATRVLRAYAGNCRAEKERMLEAMGRRPEHWRAGMFAEEIERAHRLVEEMQREELTEELPPTGAGE